jgi:hypothetical protein
MAVTAEDSRGARGRTRWRGVALASLLLLASAACGSKGASTEDASTSVSSTSKPPVVPSTGGTSTTAGATTTTTTGATTSTTDASPPTGGATTDCSTLLRQGCNGNDVVRLQKLLNSKGFGRTPVDGTFGGHLLLVDGAFGGQTAAALDRFEDSCSSRCTKDGRIVIDGDEWAYLESLPSTDPQEDSG